MIVPTCKRQLKATATKVLQLYVLVTVSVIHFKIYLTHEHEKITSLRNIFEHIRTLRVVVLLHMLHFDSKLSPIYSNQTICCINEQ